jgi:hypothetical protein
MADKPAGRRLRLTPARKLVLEMLHHARKQPSIPVARTMNVGRLAELRQEAALSLSWTALFLRGYGLVAQLIPELRRAYIPWPRAHLYEHPVSIGAVVVERELDGEIALLAAKVRAPEDASVENLAAHLRRFKEAPVRSISDFRQLLRLARLPGPLRRFLFWHTLNWNGARRAKRFGTFMLSSYGNLGAEQLHPLTPLTSLLTFGPISPTGDVVVKIIYDHRVLDGRRVAVALAELERVLQNHLPHELERLLAAKFTFSAEKPAEWLVGRRPAGYLPGSDSEGSAARWPGSWPGSGVDAGERPGPS